MRRIGLFGGTFDPPHLGHLALAEHARDRLRLDEVRFVPAGQPPHKRGATIAKAAARLAMTRRAVRGNPAFTVSTLEIRRGGPSFTVATLRAVAAERPRARLYLLIGADSLDDFATWHEPEAILRLATLVVAGRPGAGAAPRVRGPARRGGIVRLDNAEIALSSSLVRARVRAGRSVRYLVPDAVAAYIARHRLYRRRA
ncbi:MAG: nicotinate-nucleotide adenylyltransferase [Candidatus Eisenbacteria bacterium]|uniref:Probable nicotinate-nucleotide adenylyltransferase n=1 Tax=Eiseniibacteriota bacterium TaxID=2212470 RepID=A0A538U7D1_UNCEI|nr:MAG: nicotinate-nucleotide adenylyltransferase [Candidatus Eisenbacteria bacterium]